MLNQFGGIDFCICLGVLMIVMIILALKKCSFFYLLFFFIFGIYIINVINLVIFPVWIPGLGAPSLGERFQHNINLIPFNFGVCYIEDICRGQIMDNIILTMPFGFGICFVARLKAHDFLWLPITVGLGFELSQFVISQGGFHILDINDVILNATGVILGYICFRIFGWIYRGAIHQLNVNPRWVFGYVYEAVGH